MLASQLYIGLMSGTSADAIDAVLVDLSSSPQLITHHSQKIPPALRQQIHQLCTPGAHEIDRMGVLDVELGQHFAATIHELLTISGINPGDVVAIGSHGQTIRHRPQGCCEQPFTLQIGDPNTLAELTGITTVADFRRRDMAAGGQGAPLVPAFHQAIFSSSHCDRAIVNIGGMANITWLPQAAGAQTIGFDTGPGNVLMDGWIFDHHHIAYDRNGDWAASGTLIPTLLQQLLTHPFFGQPPPKSTGREAFNREWLAAQLTQFAHPAQAADVQATLLELTAMSIAHSINDLSDRFKEVYVCGGGAYNQNLMKRLGIHIQDCRIASTAVLGVDPEWVEAMAFAWLAQQTCTRRPGNLPAVTGARREVILGGIYMA